MSSTYDFKKFYKHQFANLYANLYDLSTGKSAMACFNNLKKKFMRKKKEFRDVNRSGTSTKAIEKAEKALQQYQFMEWLSTFIQPRDGRTNLKRARIERESTIDAKEIEEEEDGLDKNENDDRDIENSCDILEDDSDRVSQRTALINDEKEVDTKDKDSQLDRPTKSKKKPRIQGAAKETLLEEMEYSILRKINLRMNEQEKRRKTDKVELKELDSEDVFCQALSLDLKKLPYYERCMAKHEMQNVLYKHQMSLMERQMRPYNFNQNQINPQSPMPPNTQTPFGIFSPTHSSSPSINSPPSTPMPNTQNSWLFDLENQQQNNK